ncbi:nucleoside hydrolase [Paenibacillus daejeonensis]|uniref:nucleoside hydrolase n=1 Tax=Paenibacillus daejeonensis TaxID=135193 RepID=UPI00036D4FF8|nr:nucleoside hydrolase [Paenibacillus daejeonensis]
MGSVNIILDTDIGPDCDDAGAVAVLHALSRLGEAHIVGMMHCTSSRWGAGCLDALNTYYGRSDIPVGTLKDQGFLDEERYASYNRRIAVQFPNRYRGEHLAPDALGLYRQLLTESEDASLVIAAIGPLRNLALLLREEPELVARKVKTLVVMGGSFPAGREWNFEMDPASARQVAAGWPTPILFAGYEVGCAILTGKRLLTDAPADHPVRQSYEAFGVGVAGRPSWDLIAVLLAVRGVPEEWRLSDPGTIEIAPDGTNRWLPGGGQHRYITAVDAPEAMEQLLEYWLVDMMG